MLFKVVGVIARGHSVTKTHRFPMGITCFLVEPCPTGFFEGTLLLFLLRLRCRSLGLPQASSNDALLLFAWTVFVSMPTAEMAYKTVEYAEQDLAGVLSGMSALHLATGPHRTRDRAAAAPAHVFVVDGNMRGEALTDLARSVDKVRIR